MLQEDSNGETGFEFVEKKIDELSVSGETAGSFSSMSSSPSLISPPSGVVTNAPGGSAATPGPPVGLLSNVPPPSELPSFIASSVPAPTAAIPQGQSVINNLPQPDAGKEPFYPTIFSPAIPPSKGVTGLSEVPAGLDTLHAEPVPNTGAGLFSWMKDAVSTGGLLSKVAEKAKSSVDSMITTLDPQMREFIYSGGDVDILVASDKELKISPIREAFQLVFGKATVSGISVQPSSIAVQPVGFAAGIKAAEERIAAIYSTPQRQPLPVVAIESFLVEVGEDRWYDIAVLMLSDPSRNIHLQTFTQTTPVPSAVAAVLAEDTPQDYPARWSGFSVPVGKVMARNLGCEHTNWHYILTGLTRREIILSGARTLAGLYKNSLKQIS